MCVHVYLEVANQRTGTDARRGLWVSCPICHFLLYSIDDESRPEPGAKLAGGKLNASSTGVKGVQGITFSFLHRNQRFEFISSCLSSKQSYPLRSVPSPDDGFPPPSGKKNKVIC